MSDYYEGLNEKLLNAIPAVTKVLELGCAKGLLGQKYKSLNPFAQWTGIDSNEEALETARTRLDQVYKLDLDVDDISIAGDGFEAVVIGDLLEHVRDPGGLLGKLKPLCKDSARLVCCIPNMSHVSVLERMIAGDITYDDMGLLDKTHLHFFSPASIYKIFMDAGWLPNLCDYYAGGTQNRKFAALLVAAGEAMGIPGATTSRNISLYQMIIECVPAGETRLPAMPARLSVVVPGNNEQQLNLNILKSPGLKEINAEVIVCKNARNAAAALEFGLARATSRWVVFCHQDVYFPRGSCLSLCNHLEAIAEEQVPDTLIGFAGMGVAADGGPFKSGLVIDRMNRFDFPSSKTAVSIDELAVVLSRDTRHKIDPELGWHLWATDLCLQAIQPENSLYAEIVRTPLFHNSYNDGNLPDSYHRSARILKAKYPDQPVIHTLCGDLGGVNQ